MGDRVQLQQGLLNLMMNSIDTMKDVDGTRELTVQSQRGEDGQVLRHFDLQACRNPATAMEHYSTISVARIGRSLIPGIGLGD
jgi:C4-dicarboxylate-specific signal transduction histidine kinase